MEEKLLKDFNLPPKPPEDARLRWRKAVGLLTRNRRRRFRYVANLKQRSQAAKTLQELRVALMVHKAAIRFSDAGRTEHKLSKETQEAGFGIEADELASIVRGHDTNGFNTHGGVKGIAEKLSTKLKYGITSSDLCLRQKHYGLNRYTEKPPRGFWTFVWDALQDLTLIILMVCAVVSVGVGIATEGLPKGMYDGVGILLSIFLVVIVTAVSDYKQSLQFIALDKEKKKKFVQVTRDGHRQKVFIYDLVVGDIVNLSTGDVVPADGIFVSGYNLLIDESSLTGESEPLHVNHERPFLLGGTKVLDGSATMLVTAVGMKTEWGKLMETLNEGDHDETPLQVKLNGVATIIGKIGLVFGVLTFLVLAIRFLVNKLVHEEFTHWNSEDALKLLDYFATAVTIIVVAVPEGLPLAVTLSLAFAMKKLMNDKALVRHLSACETMGSASSICTDKTGTLTTNHMIVDKIWVSGRNTELKGKDLKSEFSESTLTVLLQVIFLNTGAEMGKNKDGKTSIIGQPTESALLELGLLLGGDFNEYRQKYQIKNIEPFNSVRRKMSVLVALPGGGIRAFCKGASEIVLGSCNRMIDCNGNSVDLSEEHLTTITNVINDFANEALRTLCLAFRDIDDGDGENNIPEDGYTLVAVVGIKDPVRPGVIDAVRTCLAAGITVRMVTGDNINTAKAIARECGILTDGLAIEGSELRSKTPDEMKGALSRIQVMARSLPSDKHTMVMGLRTLEEVVAVTGDGTNDAPALHESDIGLAMGIAGTEVAKENADVIIMDDNFTTIVNVVKWGRAVYVNIQKFVQFQLTVNIVALMINFVSACVAGCAPLTTVQLLWVNMIMDTLGALALATEPPTDELMKRPPIGRHANFISKAMWRNILGHSVYQFTVLAVLNFDGERLLGLTGSDSQAVLNTVIFNSFVFCQVFNEINSRQIEKINVFRGIFSSWIFIGVIACTVAFQAIIVEFLGSFASTVPLSWQLWLICILIGGLGMPLGVILKCISVEPSASLQQHDGYDALASGPEQV
ncbi:putative calcium-transporting ATPase 11, plasma membrane-type isoform X1 [Amaranthus tricolor]|uniref:putative calcium-transporting ATPase 11, plasma membrane-type isoform X1 n=2 Tax=Amaranthus tricolor TaxID=29722 RepID=UPI0025906CB7|nr:putative calcium-transporting ATPase 11, plasma membrane-type isoform X1 [Amaranthus tricolor]